MQYQRIYEYCFSECLVVEILHHNLQPFVATFNSNRIERWLLIAFDEVERKPKPKLHYSNKQRIV